LATDLEGELKASWMARNSRCRGFCNAFAFAGGSLLTAAGLSVCAGVDRRTAEIREEGIMMDRMQMWKANPLDVDPQTRVVAVFGVTGSGKSSTCNTLVGGRERNFEQSSTLLSVTKAVSYRDFMYKKCPCRIIDTPGLADTHRTREEIAEELARFTALAPHGLAAILIIVPRGRFTPEQEEALLRIKELLGPLAVRHGIVVFTHCLNPSARRQLLGRDQLLDEVNQLPQSSTLRSLVEDCNYRVVPVENVLEPARSESRAHLHERVADVLAQNHGATYDVSNFMKRANQRREEYVQRKPPRKHLMNCRGDAFETVSGRMNINLVCDIDGDL